MKGREMGEEWRAMVEDGRRKKDEGFQYGLSRSSASREIQGGGGAAEERSG